MLYWLRDLTSQASHRSKWVCDTIQCLTSWISIRHYLPKQSRLTKLFESARISLWRSARDAVSFTYAPGAACNHQPRASHTMNTMFREPFDTTFSHFLAREALQNVNHPEGVATTVSIINMSLVLYTLDSRHRRYSLVFDGICWRCTQHPHSATRAASTGAWSCIYTVCNAQQHRIIHNS